MGKDLNMALAVVFIIACLFLFAWLFSGYRANKRLSLKQGLVAFLFAVISAQLGAWLMQETDSFEEAIRQLKENKVIQRQIGLFYGYRYNQNELPAATADPAVVKVTLTGSKGNLYVHCLMQKNQEGKWRLVKILEKKAEQTP